VTILRSQKVTDMRFALALMLLSTTSLAVAQRVDVAPLTSALPDPAQVAEALDTHPLVEAAHERLNAAEADQRGLSYGPQEVTVSAIASVRDVRADRQYGEVDLTVTRGIRLPGRARLDREAGRYGVLAAQNRAEDVQHQAALTLNQLWWDYLLAMALAEVDERGVANLEAARAAVARQMQLGEASQLDLDLATAAIGSAQAQLASSQGLARQAAARFRAQFPGISLPQSLMELPSPELSDASIEAMAAQVISRSHEIAAAEAERQRRDALSARARADQTPEPQVGFRLFRERGGEERGAGLVFSMPIGGGYRRAAADRTAADASAALSDRLAVTRDVEEMASSDAAMVRAALATWQGRRAALNAYVDATARSRRGYALGALDLSDLLLAERQSAEAFRAAAEARIAALRAICQLMIDSHNLWIGGDEVHEDH
jgi:outer membrane protein, heavy metal efflux system